MSAFYPNSSTQVDLLSTPYVQDQTNTSYSESSIIHGNNMMMHLHGASSEGISTHSSIDRNEMIFNALGVRKLNGLSLSLNTHVSTAILPASYEQCLNPGISPVDKVDEPFQNSMRFGAPNNLQDLVNNKGVGYNVHQYEQAGATRAIMKYKFIKAVQELLDEVVSVHDALKQQDSGKDLRMKKVEDGVNESASVQSEELSANERQDLQNKLERLLAMLDEADRRYKQYHHQMQVLVSSFEMNAGCGAAKPYTTLALKTISRHFRSLRDALSVQIQATRKSLGVQDCGQGGVIPRLRYVDQQLRQHRELQQFGMMRHAWRPQRGLPENAVTILRAWLFEHFLHPYPKDSEKTMLARQTGLTRSQVGNWFINARVRLWKPMVEEMYKEEFGEAELNLKSSPENAPTQDWRGEELQENFTSMADGNHHSTDMNHSHGSDDKHKEIMKLHDNHHNMNNHGFYPHDQNGVTVVPFQVDSQLSLALGLRRIDGPSSVNPVGPESETAQFSYFGQVYQQHKFGNTHLLDDFVV